MTTLTPTDLKTLEQTRQRLAQLTTSLASLQQSILQSDPLPPWPSLISHLTILSHSLSSLSTHLSTHEPLLSSLSVFPMPSFPGQAQEALLHQLLRKKLEVGVEEWVVRGRGVGEGVLGAGGVKGEEVEALWQWAAVAANEEARRYEWGGDGGEEEEEEDEDGDDEEEEGGKEGGGEGGAAAGGKPLAVEEVLRFLVRGEAGKG